MSSDTVVVLKCISCVSSFSLRQPHQFAALHCCCICRCHVSWQYINTLTVRQLMQIETGPAHEHSHALHPSDTPLSIVREHITASQAPAVAGGFAESAHDYAASAQPVDRMRSDVPDQAPAALPPPGQARSWRQLISQPLYPERLPATCQGRGDASSAPDPTHAAARKQECPPASLGGSCSHSSASPRQEVRSYSSRAAVKGKAWSADLYKESSGIPGPSTAAAQAPISYDAPAVHVLAQGGSTAASGAQYAKHTGAASLRSKTSLRQASVERTAQAAPGKENDKRQVQAEHRHDAEQLQKRASHQQSVPQGKGMKNETPTYGSPRSVQTSSPFTPRLGARGECFIQTVAKDLPCIRV